MKRKVINLICMYLALIWFAEIFSCEMKSSLNKKRMLSWKIDKLTTIDSQKQAMQCMQLQIKSVEVDYLKLIQFICVREQEQMEFYETQLKLHDIENISMPCIQMLSKWKYFNEHFLWALNSCFFLSFQSIKYCDLVLQIHIEWIEFTLFSWNFPAWNSLRFL